MQAHPSDFPNISFRRFFAELDRLRETLLARDGIPFESFTRGTPFEWEGYKDEVCVEARRRLGVGDWDVSEVGTGAILERVIHAIEIKGNNLLKWAQFGIHNVLKESLTNPRCFAVESLLFDFYSGELDAEDVFDPLVEELGGKYPLLAYLFFIRDCDRFLPISPDHFDKVFVRLGIDLKTSGKCGWQNYSAYIAAIRQVQNLLHIEGYANTRLLDAHSFCWLLAGLGDESTGESPTISIQVINSLPVMTGSERGGTIDWEALHRARAELGRLGEEFAEIAERDRLVAAGCIALAEKVRLVRDDHKLGYDLHSYETDGRDRLIEVKTVAQSGGQARFYTTFRQLELARSGVNHFYYLVRGARTATPTILAACRT